MPGRKSDTLMLHEEVTIYEYVTLTIFWINIRHKIPRNHYNNQDFSFSQTYSLYEEQIKIHRENVRVFFR